MMPTGFGDETASYVTSDNLAAGQLVNIYNNSGVPTARLADGSVTTKRCDGYVVAVTTSPAVAVVYGAGFNNNCSGLVAGDVFLSQVTPGLATNTVPATAGGISQRVGTAASATSLDFDASAPVIEL